MTTRAVARSAALASAVLLAAVLAGCGDDGGGDADDGASVQRGTTLPTGSAREPGGSGESGGGLCERMHALAVQLFGPDVVATTPPLSTGNDCDWTVEGPAGSVTFSGQLFDAGAAGFPDGVAMVDLYRQDPVFGSHVADLDLGDAAIRTFDAERPENGEQVFVASGGLLAIVLSPGGGEGTGRALATAILDASGEDVAVDLVPYRPSEPGRPCELLTVDELAPIAGDAALAIAYEQDRACGYDAADARIAVLSRAGTTTSLTDPRRSITDFTTTAVDGAYLSRARGPSVFERVIVRFVASDGYVYDLELLAGATPADPVDLTDEQLLDLVAVI